MNHHHFLVASTKMLKRLLCATLLISTACDGMMTGALSHMSSQEFFSSFLNHHEFENHLEQFLIAEKLGSGPNRDQVSYEYICGTKQVINQ